ncbi:hypothetical protein HOP52_15125 [Halomonas campisalis]|uniref:Putative zinc-finger domain-containing protein n=1 Tax=Billgrantia campisalis TaxID=74661 RepID=A0ABS9PBD7_9GAMM|nr:zf-HC2 domain-containing protein [Halomonas campisalis]MCG6659090.1 hypothetical protein [Halomonas campisalis]MDR5863876.1 zf-HC2 domain-containing protein [Halomonas campisalis]
MNDLDRNDTAGNAIEEKLPLYVNGRLDDEERRQVERALAEDPELAREVEFQMALKETLQQSTDEPPVELGLARLQRDIHRETAASQPPSARTRRYWKPLALAACLLLAIQTGFQLTTLSTDSDWALLSGEPTPPGPQLRIAFHDTATAEQIRDSLGSREARIVDGPGALGLYTIQLPAHSDSDTIRRELDELPFVEEVSSP